MKKISNIFLYGVVTVVLFAAACAPVEDVTSTLPAQAETSSTTPLVTDSAATSQATATDTNLTPAIPVTGLELIRLDCQYCVDNIAHAQLVIPREASFKVTSPPELASDDDDDDGDGDGGHRRTAQLSGAAEVPGPGDPDGSGTAMVRLSLEASEVCFDLTTSNIGPATAAHIHEGAEGVAGEVVIPLDPAPTEGSSSGCITNVDTALIENIVENPEQYYVNVHNEEFPDGAIRGQLSRVDGDEDDDDDNEDRMGCRVIDRFRDKKLVLCRAEENTAITMNVCMDENNCTEVQLTLQACALASGTPTATSTLVTTATASTTTLTPTVLTATATVTSTTATSTVPVATETATPTSSLTNTPVAPSSTATATSTFTPTATFTPTP